MNLPPHNDLVPLNLQETAVEGNLGGDDGNPSMTGERFSTEPARTHQVFPSSLILSHLLTRIPTGYSAQTNGSIPKSIEIATSQ